MNALSAPFLAAAGLLVAAGILKLGRPAATAQTLRTQRLPSGTQLVRLLGAGEIAVGSAALLDVPYAAGALAAAYAAFTLFVLVPVLRGRPLSSCGCFAEPDLPPTAGHLLVTATLAGCAVAVSAGRPGGLPAVAGASAPLALSVCISAAIVGWLAYLVLTGLPRLLAATAAAAPHTHTPRSAR